MKKICFDRIGCDPVRGSRLCFPGCFLTILIAVLAAAAACGTTHTPLKEVGAQPPSVTYSFSTDAELLEANQRARVYCGQWATKPWVQGLISNESDDTKTVTFQCVKASPQPPPSSLPASSSFSSDAQLLDALESAAAYCEDQGKEATSSIVTNPDGTKALSSQCSAQ